MQAPGTVTSGVLKVLAEAEGNLSLLGAPVYTLALLSAFTVS